MLIISLNLNKKTIHAPELLSSKKPTVVFFWVSSIAYSEDHQPRCNCKAEWTLRVKNEFGKITMNHMRNCPTPKEWKDAGQEGGTKCETHCDGLILCSTTGKQNILLFWHIIFSLRINYSVTFTGYRKNNRVL